MATLPAIKTVTYEEWLEMPAVEDGIEEVVDGEIRVMPPPFLIHALVVRAVWLALEASLRGQNAIALGSDFGLVIRRAPLSTRVPDVAVFQTTTIVERDGYIHSAPQLIVEVLSPANTRREREAKLRDYAALGVPEVWVLSPEAATAEVLILEGGQYASQVLRHGVLQPKLFPDVKIEVDSIWPDVTSAR